MNPLRAVLVVLVVGAGIVVAYSLFVDSSSAKLPLMVSSLAVLGIALGLLGFALASSAVRLGQVGHGIAALGVAFVGGLCVLGAAGSVAAAIVLGILAAGAG